VRADAESVAKQAALKISALSSSGSLGHAAITPVGGLSPGQCRVHETGIKMISEYLLQDGRRLGTRRVSSIDTAFVDDLFGKLLFKDVNGEKIERRTTVNHAMKTARGAWNTVSRAQPGMFPAKNPFEKMGLQSTSRETPFATFAELQAFRSKAVEMGYQSIATGALIGWEFLQREHHIYTVFKAEHYRPDNHSGHVHVVNPKTKKGDCCIRSCWRSWTR
jgi:hypothetical protein